jgi:hypothetical protein
VEIFSWDNTTGSTQTVRLAIARCGPACNPGSDNAAPRLKFVLVQNGGGVDAIEYPRSAGGNIVGPSIFGHNGAASAVSVGAIRFNTNSSPEGYSSRGPVVHYFGPVDGTTPAPALPDPTVISKPDLVATDCGVTTFFVETATPGLFRFCGTSAAAPHVAGIAALAFDAAPLLAASTITQAQIETADPVGAFGPCDVGAGRVNAVDALEEALSPGAGTSPTACAPPLSPPVPPDPTLPTVASTPQVLIAPPAGDRTPPGTFIVRVPAKIVEVRGLGRRLVLRFGSSEEGVTFLCKIDRTAYWRCGRRLARWFGIGAHTVQVKARDAVGNVDLTPAVYRFQVKRLR